MTRIPTPEAPTGLAVRAWTLVGTGGSADVEVTAADDAVPGGRPPPARAGTRARGVGGLHPAPGRHAAHGSRARARGGAGGRRARPPAIGGHPLQRPGAARRGRTRRRAHRPARSGPPRARQGQRGDDPARGPGRLPPPRRGAGRQRGHHRRRSGVDERQPAGRTGPGRATRELAGGGGAAAGGERRPHRRARRGGCRTGARHRRPHAAASVPAAGSAEPAGRDRLSPPPGAPAPPMARPGGYLALRRSVGPPDREDASAHALELLGAQQRLADAVRAGARAREASSSGPGHADQRRPPALRPAVEPAPRERRCAHGAPRLGTRIRRCHADRSGRLPSRRARAARPVDGRSADQRRAGRHRAARAGGRGAARSSRAAHGAAPTRGGRPRPPPGSEPPRRLGVGPVVAAPRRPGRPDYLAARRSSPAVGPGGTRGRDRAGSSWSWTDRWTRGSPRISARPGTSAS